MNLLEKFRVYLFSLKDKPTKITVKNYLSDIRKFILWYETVKKSAFNPIEVNLIDIKEFEEEKLKTHSASSVKRILSSMHKFFYFLKETSEIAVDPFSTLQTPKTENLDPIHLHEFKNFLFTTNSSRLTIKNYVIDINQYINWLRKTLPNETNNENLLNFISENSLSEYKERLVSENVFSKASVNRKLSSLKKYFLWMKKNNYLKNTNLENISKDNFKDQKVQDQFFTENEVKQYGKKPYSKFPPLRLLQKSLSILSFLFEGLLITPAVSLIKKGDYELWKVRGKKIFAKNSQLDGTPNIDAIFSHIPKSIYAPLKISTANFNKFQKLIYHLKYTRPSWYRRYHQTIVAHYFNLAVLFVFCSAIGVSLYAAFIKTPGKQGIFAAGPSSPLRILSFQGRLTDNSDNPITTTKNVRFIIYNDSSASGSARLWEEVDQVSPDTNGIFSILLGSNGSGGNAGLCNGGNPPSSPATGACGIPQSLFANNPTLYLAVTIENTSELTPRQQIATVPFATNAEVLQGLPPTTDSAWSSGSVNTNAVLALNGSGVVNLAPSGSTSTTILQSTGGQVTLTGKVLLLNTASGTNTNVQLTPDGTGLIDLQKPLENTSLNGNLKSASTNTYTTPGAVEVDDLFGVLATSSGQSAFTIDQEGAGPVISASKSGLPIFTVDGSGNGTFTGNVAGSTGNFNNLNISNTVTSNLNPSAADTYSLGTSASNEWLNLYVHNIYANGQALTQLWQLNAGALSPINITNDLLLGTTATTGARFGFINVAGGTPTASISAGTSGALVIDATGLIQTTAGQTLTLGSSTTGSINIGTDADARLITIGNTTGASGLAEKVGTGNYSLDGVGASTYSLGASTTTGTVTIGGTAQTGNLTLGSSTGTNSVLIGNGSGATTVSIANGATNAKTVNIATGAVGNTINIGTTNSTATLNLLSGTGNINLGNNTNNGNVIVAPNAGGSAALIVNKQGNLDIFTASASGNTRFTIQNSGTLVDSNYTTDKGITYFDSTGTLLQTAQGAAHTLLHGNGTSAPTFSAVDLTADVSNILPIANGGTNTNTTPTAGQVAYGTGTAYGFTSGGSDGQCLTKNGTSAPSWTSCSVASGNFWTLSSPTGGAIVPINNTFDVLVGGNSTASAKFGLLNVNSGTPTASISAGTSGALFLTASGNIQTTASQNITIGGGASGFITLNPQSSTGITFSGYGTGIIHSTSGVLSSSAINLASGDVTGTLGVGNGGTGNGSVASGALLYGAGGTTALTPLTIGANNSVLVSNGSVPSWTTSPTFGGNLTVNGNTTFGTNSTNTVTFNASLASNIIPNANGTLNLGSSSLYFNNIYANNIIGPATSGTSGFWVLSSNTLYPVSTNFDLLIGGTATGSATPWQVFANSVGVNTAGTATSSGNLSFRGSSTTINSLNGGSLNFQSSVGGDAGLSSNLYIANNGSIGIGNVTNPNNFKLQIAGTIGPNSTNTYDLGSTGNVWANVYATQFKQGASHLNVLDTSNVSGTLNFIPKFTATNTIGNSIIFDDGSNHVGINNSTPSFLLDVAQIGNSATTNLGKVKIADDLWVTTSSPSALAIFDNTGSGDILTASSSGATKWTVDTNGNVTESGNEAVNGGSLTTTQTTANLFNSTVTTLHLAEAGTTISIGNSSGTTTVNNALTTTGTFTSNGNTVLGASSSNTINVPGRFISDLIPNATDTYNLGSASNEWNNLYVKQIISPVGGGIAGYWQLNSNVLSPSNNWNDLAIGGTGTSSAKFNIFGLANGSIPAGTASTSGQLTFNTTSQVNLINGASLAFKTATSGQGDSGLNSTPAFYIRNNNNVGIGTGSPSTTLSVVSSNTITLATNTTYAVNISQGTGGLLGMGGDANYSYIQSFNSKPLQINSQGNGVYLFSNDNTNASFAIGTTSPLAKSIDFEKNAQGNAALVVNQQNTVGDIIVASSSATGANTTQFRVTNAGNVVARQFVDLDNSNYFLDPAATGTSLRLAGTASESGDLTFDTSGFHNINLLNGASLNIQTATSGQGNAGLSTELTLLNNGNLGLGTTSPNQLLHLASTSTSDVAQEWESNNSSASYNSPTFFPNSASTNSTGTCAGSNANNWTNPGYIEQNNGNAASLAFTTISTGRCIQGTNFGFGINGNATILGIQATVHHSKSSTASTITDNDIQLVKGGTATGSNKAATSTDWGTSGTTVTYGSSTDLWGASWAPSDINNSSFGINVAPQETTTAASINAQVSYVELTVWYKDPGIAEGIQETTGIFKISNSQTLGTDDSFSLDSSTGNIAIGNTPSAFSHQLTIWDTSTLGSSLEVGEGSSRGNAQLFVSRGSANLDKAGTYYSTSGITNWFTGLPYNNGLATSTFVISQTDYLNDAIGDTHTPEFTINTSGDVGIGTTSAERPLSIMSSGTNGEWIGFQNSTTKTTQWHINNKNGNWNLAETNVADGRIYIEPGGHIGIDNTSPSSSYALDVNGHVHASGGFDGTCLASGAFNTSNGTACNADVAEIYPSEENVNSGDLLVTGTSTIAAVRKSTFPYEGNILGVVSTIPGLILGKDGTNLILGGASTTYETTTDALKNPAVALTGKVPLNITDENGIIHKGDMITSSNLAGYGMKATQAGRVVGIALDDFNLSRAISQTLPSGKVVNTEQLLVYVNPSWYDPDVYLTDTGDFNIFTDKNSPIGGYSISDQNGNLISRVEVLAEAAIAHIKAGLIETQQLTTNSLSITTDNITIAGQNLHDYIATIVQQTINNQPNGSNNGLLSPIATTEHLQTHIISPIDNSNISAVFGNSKLEIKNSSDATSGATVASIDNAGNATFSGNLSSQNLAVNSDATISGTLYANKIEASQIDGLDAKLSTLSAQNITNVTNIYFATPSATISSDSAQNNDEIASSPSANLLSEITPSIGYTDISSYSGFLANVPSIHSNFGQFDQGLVSLGPTSLSDTTIAGELSINSNFIIANNSINVLDQDLDLQPLRQGGINLEAGALAIDTNGNLTINGKTIFNNQVFASLISPLSGQNLNVNLGSSPTGTNSASQFIINNASNSAVVAINQNGDITSSGSANINKLNLNLVSPALAVSDTEVVATGSAGTTQINSEEKEITIDNPSVTANSLIYITPVGNPSGQTPFLLRQVAGKSFTVGVTTYNSSPIQFNWLIVN